jgi:hypothetical protein
MVMSKFTLPVAQKKASIDKATDSLDERRYYKWEDKILLQQAEASFHFLSTFIETDKDGIKSNYAGSKDGKETQYRLVYLISYKNYLTQI